jgi:hypothetical protein
MLPVRLKYAVWQEPYIAAMTELDSRKIPRKLAAAKEAIYLRMGGADGEEHEAILAALNALQFFSKLVPMRRGESLPNVSGN